MSTLEEIIFYQFHGKLFHKVLILDVPEFLPVRVPSTHNHKQLFFKFEATFCRICTKRQLRIKFMNVFYLPVFLRKGSGPYFRNCLQLN